MPERLDYYAILEIPRTATIGEIKDAYFALSKKYHPNTQAKKTEAEKKEAASRMVKLNEAYGVLTDPRKRSAYDRGENVSAAASSPSAAPAPEASPRRAYAPPPRESAEDFFMRGYKPSGPHRTPATTRAEEREDSDRGRETSGETSSARTSFREASQEAKEAAGPVEGGDVSLDDLLALRESLNQFLDHGENLLDELDKIIAKARKPKRAPRP